MANLQRPKAHMPWWLVEKVAADFRDNGIRVNWLHEMGEPLLYPHLAEAIDLFPGCSVSTNTMLLDRATAERILASTLGRIRLCVDTLNPDVYPTIRKGGKFEQVVGNIRTFLELSLGHEIRVEIQRMITRPTAHETVRGLPPSLRARPLPAGAGDREDLRGARHLRRHRPPRLLLRVLPGLPVQLVHRARPTAGSPTAATTPTASSPSAT